MRPSTPIRAFERIAHYLDWENQPIPFKVYTQLEPIPLPQHLSSSGLAALEAISTLGSFAKGSSRSLDSNPGGDSSICLPASPNVEAIRVARSSFARRPVPVHSIISICTSSAAICRNCKREFITSVPMTSLCAGSVPGITVVSLCRRAAERACPSQRPGYHRLRFDLLAQCLEIPVTRLSALLLGHRHYSRQSASWRGRPSCAGADRPRLRRR